MIDTLFDKPLFAFLLLMLVAVVPTYFIYRVIGRVIEANPATFEGSVSGFVVKLGGPVAFFAFLVVFGSVSYIKPTVPMVNLAGQVTSVDGGSSLENYSLGIFPGIVKQFSDSKFTVATPKSDEYTVVVMNDDRSFTLVRQLTKQQLENPQSIAIADFPNVRETTVKQEGEAQFFHSSPSEEEPPRPYRVELTPTIWPPSAELKKGTQVEFTIKNGYIAVYKDKDGNRFHEEPLPPIVLGQELTWRPQIKIQ